ncbi:MAG: hypothetical protein ACE5EU_04565 [Paracoccaceae bacterium]
MQARSTRLLIPILALVFIAGCAPIGERYWPAAVTEPAGAASVTRGADTITIVTHSEGNDGNPVSPTDLGYNAALLRAARETEAAGYSRFQVVDTDTYVLSRIINQVGAPQRVRYTMTIRPAGPGDGAGSRKYHDTAEVLAGPRGGLL